MQQAVAAVAPGSLVLGRYRPLRPLGSGGSGSVWLARDEQSGLDVALKIVPREGKAAARAEREAAAASRLRHPSCLRAIEAAAQICEGLAHAHGAGILHRDVKPSNVLLAEEGERISARLLDFGLARMQEAETLTA